MIVAFCIFFLIGFIFLGMDPVATLSANRDFASYEFTYNERILTQLRVLLYNISLVFFPHPSRLNCDYDFPISHSLVNPLTTTIALFAILSLISFSLLSAKKKRIASFCILWFFGNLVIESTFIPLALIYEYRTYLPSMLVPLLVVSIASRYFKSRLFPILFFLCIIVPFSIWTYQRNMVWKNEVTFWRDCARKSPNKSRPHSNIAAYLLSEGDLEGAKSHATRAIEITDTNAYAYLILSDVFKQKGDLDKAVDNCLLSIRYKPDNPQAYNSLGNICIVTDQGSNKKSCHQLFRKALSLDPNLENARYNLGIHFLNQNQIDDAIFQFEKIVEINPSNEKTFFILGLMYAKANRPKQAMKNLLTTISIDPEHAKAHNNIGIILEQSGDINSALSHYETAVRINPEYAQAQNNLGLILIKLNRLDNATRHLSKAIEIKPEYPEAHNNLGLVMELQGKIQNAIMQYKKAIELKPDLIRAYNNLGILFFRSKRYQESITYFSKALEIDPSRKDIRHNLKKVLSKKK